MKNAGVVLWCVLMMVGAVAGGGHPDSSQWNALFNADLSNAERPEGVWSVEQGVMTASDDKAIWTTRDFENFVLDLEFKTAPGSNSGVLVYCTDTEKWIPNSIEIQLTDDFFGKWAKSRADKKCGSIYGRLAPTKSMVKKPGEWNRCTITCKGQKIDVVMNGELVTSMDMALWTEKGMNPNGSKIPSWLSRPASEFETNGRIGFQGKHAGAPIYFRNIRIKEL